MQTSIGIRACGRYCICVTNDCTAPKLASQSQKHLFQKMVVAWCTNDSFLCMQPSSRANAQKVKELCDQSVNRGLDGPHIRSASLCAHAMTEITIQKRRTYMYTYACVKYIYILLFLDLLFYIYVCLCVCVCFMGTCVFRSPCCAVKTVSMKTQIIEI